VVQQAFESSVQVTLDARVLQTLTDTLASAAGVPAASFVVGVTPLEGHAIEFASNSSSVFSRVASNSSSFASISSSLTSNFSFASNATNASLLIQPGQSARQLSAASHRRQLVTVRALNTSQCNMNSTYLTTMTLTTTNASVYTAVVAVANDALASLSTVLNSNNEPVYACASGALVDARRVVLSTPSLHDSEPRIRLGSEPADSDPSLSPIRASERLGSEPPSLGA
jgi:hypothetical protein